MDKNLIKGDRKNGTIIKREWKHQPVERTILDFVDLTRSSFIEIKKNEFDEIKLQAVWKFSKENFYRQLGNKKENT